MEFVKFFTVLAWVAFVVITTPVVLFGIAYCFMTPLERKCTTFKIYSWTWVVWIVSFSWIVSRYL